VAWIESHQELGSHPKTRKLAQLLGVTRAQAVGHLQMLWWWALDYAEDGDLSQFDASDIALGADWEGDADEFVAALMACGPGGKSGFLDADKTLHDWDQYAGRLVERRKKDRQRKADARAREAARTSNGHDAEIRAAANVHNTTEPNPTVESAQPASPRQRRGTRIPDDFVVSAEMRSWVSEHCPGLDWRDQTERFCDYWRAKAGAGATKTDWVSTWRNWMRRAYDERRPQKPRVVEV